MNQKKKQLPAVWAKGLTKTFRLNWRRGSLLALDSLDLEIRQGEIFGLLGPNGSGKSTTMKLLLGLIRPSAGDARILDHPIGSMAARKKVGFLPENPYFPAFLSGREVLRYYGKLVALSGPELREREADLLKLVSLEKAADRPLRTYSKGMLQRIGLAQALLHNPDILFLDEPTAGVDPIGSRQMRDLMIRLREEGKTVIFSSHLLEQVEEVSDRVAILHQGQKLCQGALEELLAVPDDLEVRLSEIDDSTRRRIEEFLKSEGLKSAEIRRPRMSLEEFFIKQVVK